MKNMKLVNVTIILFLCHVIYAQGIIPTLDISNQKFRQTIVAQGTENEYQGHPTTVLLSDSLIYCVWTLNHGGPCGPMAISSDGGISWKNITTPADWKNMKNCPSIYYMTDKKGVNRLIIFASYPEMAQTFSVNMGKSWSPVKSLGISCVMPLTSMVRLKNGDYLAMYNRRPIGENTPPKNEICQIISKDGGLTWGIPQLIVPCSNDNIPCEPCVFQSPNGKQLACLIRDNNRDGQSLIIFSKDEGKTWSSPTETPWGLTGDRHIVKYAQDGRLVVVFRDMAPLSPTKGHFVAWVGHYDDLIRHTSGLYRIKLLHSFSGSDCGYPGLEILPDGTFVATTYIKYKEGKEKNSVVSLRFNLSETDKMMNNGR